MLWNSNIPYTGTVYVRLILALLLPSHTHTHTNNTYTHEWEARVPVFLADGGVELVTPPLGVRPGGLQYHKADPLQPAWLGSSTACPPTPTAGT